MPNRINGGFWIRNVTTQICEIVVFPSKGEPDFFPEDVAPVRNDDVGRRCDFADHRLGIVSFGYSGGSLFQGPNASDHRSFRDRPRCPRECRDSDTVRNFDTFRVREVSVDQDQVDIDDRPGYLRDLDFVADDRALQGFGKRTLECGTTGSNQGIVRLLGTMFDLHNDFEHFPDFDPSFTHDHLRLPPVEIFAKEVIGARGVNENKF